jgi:hypothetical protein
VRGLLGALVLTAIAGVAAAQDCSFTIAVRAPKYLAIPNTCLPDTSRPWAGLDQIAYLEVYGRADGDIFEVLAGFVDFAETANPDSTAADSLYHAVRVRPWHSIADYRFRVEAINIGSGRATRLCAPIDQYYFPPLGTSGLRRGCWSPGEVWIPGR